MHAFLEKREVTSFSINGDFSPKKQNFETTVQQKDGILTTLPDGSTVKILCKIVTSYGWCFIKENTYKNGKLHGKCVVRTFSSPEEVEKEVEGEYRHGKLHGRWTMTAGDSVSTFFFAKGKLLEWTEHFGEEFGIVSRNDKKGKLYVLEKKKDSNFGCSFFEIIKERNVPSRLGLVIQARTYKNFKCITREFSPEYREEICQNFPGGEIFCKGRLVLSRSCLLVECPSVQEELKNIVCPVIISTFRPGQ
uniref:MORN repeat containing protein n=1 Tax=Marseillevirus sp. TaxID=2809551 RepID=A0AA96ELQ1_9VIRU|nr:MORN repeat containing protein [Marseillevirus sp.]